MMHGQRNIKIKTDRIYTSTNSYAVTVCTEINIPFNLPCIIHAPTSFPIQALKTATQSTIMSQQMQLKWYLGMNKLSIRPSISHILVDIKYVFRGMQSTAS